MKENEITKKVIGCAIEVHRQLGPGLLETVYEEALCYELSRIGPERGHSCLRLERGREYAG